MIRRHCAAGLALALALTGCDGKTIIEPPGLPEGCGEPLACQVSGVDLVVGTPVLLLEPDQQRDAQTGMPVILPGDSVTYVMTIWNRGDTPSDSFRIAAPGVSDSLASLAPGQVFVDTVRAVPYDHGYNTDTTTIHVFLLDMQYGTEIDEEPYFANSAAVSEPVIIANPVLRAELEFPDSVAAGEAFAARITVRNSSRFADLPTRTLAFCLVDFDIGCGGHDIGAMFFRVDMPAIPSGGEWAADLDVVIPPLAAHFAAFGWRLYACLGPAGAALDAPFPDGFRCIPDYTSIIVTGGPVD